MKLFQTVMALAIGFIVAGCGCNDVPEIDGCDDGPCLARKDETQLTCQCALDVSAAGEAFTSSEDQVFNMQVCMPPELNLETANEEQLAAIEAMTDQEFAAAANAYCEGQVATALTGLIGLMTGSDPRACDNVTATCIATEVADGRATSVNETCNLPCDTIPCNTATCPPCEVNEGCNDPSLRGVHPEQCKCTSAQGCGVTSEDVCTVPTWAPDPPTIAVGMAAWHFSQPTEIQIDRELSQMDVSVFVDVTDPCGSDTDTASPHVGGTVTLFGTPCPGESCELLMDAELNVDNFGLDFDIELCPDGSVDVNAGTLSVGGEGVLVSFGPDGCGTIAAGDMRVSAGALLNLDGDLQRKKYDSTNTEAFTVCVDFENNTFEIPTANLSLTDGSASLHVVGNIINQPPLADAGDNQLVECNTTDGAEVVLDGTASFDPDGQDDIRGYTWWLETPLDENSLVDFGPTINTVAPLGGPTPYFLTVSDLRFITMASRTEIAVEDTTPPEITVEVTPDLEWPPNHEMIQFNAAVDVVDVCDDAPAFVLTDITSSEPDNDIADGDTIDDIQEADFGTADTTFLLRRERQGTGEGRVYTVTYTVTDGSGNSASAFDEVVIPHNQSPN